MLNLGIVIGSTRPQRNGAKVGHWVYEIARKRSNDTLQFEVIDLVDHDLPLLDEPEPAASNHYTKDHTKRWSATIARLDGFVFVTPEYNHGTSAALKNSIDFLCDEWNNKAAGFVSYGSTGGLRAVEHLRSTLTECQVASVRNQVSLSIYYDFENFTELKPLGYQEASVDRMLDQLIAWSGALKTLRS